MIIISKDGRYKWWKYILRGRRKLICHYRPQRSCEGYVFTGVCLSTGGVPGPGGSAPGGGLLWGVPGPMGSPPRGVPGPGGVFALAVPGPSGRVCSRGVPGPMGGIPACTEADPPPPGRDGYCCGWYTSYWNAFLFEMLSEVFTIIAKITDSKIITSHS